MKLLALIALALTVETTATEVKKVQSRLLSAVKPTPFIDVDPRLVGGTKSEGATPSKPATNLLANFFSNLLPSAPPAPPERLSQTYDDSQTKRQVGDEGLTSRNSNSGGGKDAAVNPKSTVSGGAATNQVFPKVAVMCAFVDPGYPGANAKLKALVDMAAQCQVNLALFPYYIKGNYPRNASGLNALAQRKCNAIQGFQNVGVGRAAVVTMTTNSSLPLQMCGASGASAKDIPACGQLAYDPGEAQKLRMASTGRYGGVSSGVAASIVGPLASLSDLASASIGQAMMAMPPGYGAGNGTGDFDEGYGGGGSGDKAGWGDKGCAQFRAVAFDNKINWKYRADQQNYLPPKITNVNNLMDISDPRQLFKGAIVASKQSGGGSGGGGGASPIDKGWKSSENSPARSNGFGASPVAEQGPSRISEKREQAEPTNLEIIQGGHKKQALSQGQPDAPSPILSLRGKTSSPGVIKDAPKSIAGGVASGGSSGLQLAVGPGQGQGGAQGGGSSDAGGNGVAIRNPAIAKPELKSFLDDGFFGAAPSAKETEPASRRRSPASVY